MIVLSKYKFCVFDFDLTLVNSVSPIVKCFKHALSAFGYAVPDDKTIIDTIGLPLTDAFDILTNLYPVPEKAQMRPNVLDYEPSLALFVPDEDPLCFYRAIASQASRLLAPGGGGMVEINETLGGDTAAVFRAAGFAEVEVRKDFAEKPRFVTFRGLA